MILTFRADNLGFFIWLLIEFFNFWTHDLATPNNTQSIPHSSHAEIMKSILFINYKLRRSFSDLFLFFVLHSSSSWKSLKDESRQPLIFHVFSGGGSNIYAQLIKEINQYNSAIVEQTINVVGVVFDSCPCRPGFVTAQKSVVVSSTQATSESNVDEQLFTV